MEECVKIKGIVTGRINYKNGETKAFMFSNAVVLDGREFLASCLLQSPGTPPFVANMLFGDGGTSNGMPKEVVPTQNRLNGVVRLKKPVIAQIDPEVKTRVIFTIIMEEQEVKDATLNEMGLELSNEKFLSIATFPDLNMTEQMESIMWGWEIQVI